MKIYFFIILLVTGILTAGCSQYKNISGVDPKQGSITQSRSQPGLEVERILSGMDKDSDGIDDLEDIVQGARAEAVRKPKYTDSYYQGGYPPDSEGVCTDVIWRSFRDAGYNLKSMIDKDIKNNLKAYPRVNGRPEPNIDFRRVPNLVSFFKRHADILTTEIVPNNTENLKQWQGGDIVVYGAPLWHIGIVSDKRRSDGVPLIIHNSGPHAEENDMLTDWPSPMIYHFRFPKTTDSGNT